MQITKKPEIVSLNASVKLVVNQEIVDKIRFLCKQIAKVEWSGVLFYKVNGSIKDVDTLSLEVVDIFLMHKGTKTYTEYTFDGDIAEFMMEKMMEDPSWTNIRMGHIHSHNSMDVFFSGTDTDELLENCLNHSYYLSLIVNNYLDMTAKVAFKTTQNTYTAFDEEGNPYDLEINLANPKVVMLTYDCEIDSPQNLVSVPSEFQQRYEYILQKAEREAEEAKAKVAALAKTYPINGNNYGTGGYQLNKAGSPYPNPNQTPKGWGSENRLPAIIETDRAPFQTLEEIQEEESQETSLAEAFEQEIDLVGMNELFTCFLLRKGEIIPNDNIGDALDAVKATGEPIEGLAIHMTSNFVSSYEEFFHEDSDRVVMEDYLDVLEAIIENIEEYGTVKHAFIKELTNPLIEFSMGIENAWRNVLYPTKTNQNV